MAPPPVQGRPSTSSNHSGSINNYTPFRSKNRPANKEKIPDLLCRVRYSNTMPEIPFDPKFLTCPFVDLSRFVTYKQTSLEKNYKHEVLTESDLGVKIDLINPDTYAYDFSDKVDPLDERLLEEDVVNVQDQKRSKQHSKIVPWMRKTEYISSEYNRHGTTSERQETKLGYNITKRFKEDNVYRDRESQIAAINGTFETVKKPTLTHYSKPGVTAIEELPLLPDYDLWRFPFAQVIFDSDPAPVQTPPALQAEKMSQALIRGMMDESGEQFVAYFLPTDDTLDKRRLAAAGSEAFIDGAEGSKDFDYKLSREYNWTVKNKASKGYEENYFVVFRDGRVLYNELETRVRLSRRRAKEGQPRIANSRLIVTNREFNEAEIQAQDERLLQLQHPVEEEEEEVEEAKETQPENEIGEGELEKEESGTKDTETGNDENKDDNAEEKPEKEGSESPKRKSPDPEEPNEDEPPEKKSKEDSDKDDDKSDSLFSDSD